MVKMKSHGGKRPTQQDNAREGIRAVAIFIVVIGIFVAVTLLAPRIDWPFGNDDDEAKTTAQSEQCGNIIPGSVFTTGDPLLDERILWVIVNDDSEGHETTGNIVTHIWENGDFAFEGDSERKLWAEATSAVTEPKEFTEPLLSINESGVIGPFAPAEEIEDLNWTMATVTNPPGERSTFIMASEIGETTSPPVPTVLMPVNGGVQVPAPSMGEGAKHTAVNTQEVCES